MLDHNSPMVMYLSGEAVLILNAAAEEDFDACSDKLAAVYRAYGAMGLLIVAVGISGVIIHRSVGEPPDDGEDRFLALQVPEDTPADSPELWAARLAVATGNRDMPQVMALFNTAMGADSDGDFFMDGMAALISYAVNASQLIQRVEEVDDDGTSQF